MATDTISLSTTSDEVVFPYRAINKLAVASIILFLLGLAGLIPTFETLLVFAVIGLICGLLAARSIQQFPNEFSGWNVAIVGISLNGLLLIGGASEHAYIYVTEVPDGHERVRFYELEKPKRLPDGPTEKAVEVDGSDVFIKGYIHPTSGSGNLKSFILIPDLGTCCFGGQPRSSSMIEVTLTGTKTVRYGQRQLKLAGKFSLNDRVRQREGFDNQLLYRLKANQVK